mgnify:CR=1 FL=1
MNEVYFPALFPGFPLPEELAEALGRLAVVHAETGKRAPSVWTRRRSSIWQKSSCRRSAGTLKRNMACGN